MRLMLLIVAWGILFPVYSETLSEAVQHSLILNPEVLLGSTPTINNKAHNYSSQLNHHQHSFASMGLLNTLTLNAYPVNNLHAQKIVDELVLEVSKCYMDVLLQEKLLNYAQINLRLYRSVFLTIKKKKEEGVISQQDFIALTKRLAVAEAQQIHAETDLKTAKTRYAKVVGFWPHDLTWPHLPTSKDLPASVAEAIEQGLDNYSVNNTLKKRSMAELTDNVRASWTDWTNAGLEVIRLRKEIAAVTPLVALNQEQFKKGRVNWLKYLNTQADLYQTQVSYAIEENKESFARFNIMNIVGKLIGYMNSSEMDESSDNANVGEMMQSTLEKEILVLPYPNYKPHFQGFVENRPDDQRLTEALPKNSSTTYDWYVSAGKFKNKANALALMNKLKELGFMVISTTNNDETDVLIGPYEYPGHANKGMKRLKDIAHVQGILVNNKQKNHYG